MGESTSDPTGQTVVQFKLVHSGHWSADHRVTDAEDPDHCCMFWFVFPSYYCRSLPHNIKHLEATAFVIWHCINKSELN